MVFVLASAKQKTNLQAEWTGLNRPSRKQRTVATVIIRPGLMLTKWGARSYWTHVLLALYIYTRGDIFFHYLWLLNRGQEAHCCITAASVAEFALWSQIECQLRPFLDTQISFFLWARGSFTVELARCCIRLILSPWALIYIYMLSGLIITAWSSSYGAPQILIIVPASVHLGFLRRCTVYCFCARAFLITGKIGFSTQNVAPIPLSIFSSELTAMPTVTSRHRSSRQASVSYIISSVSIVLWSELKFVNLLRRPSLPAWPI